MATPTSERRLQLRTYTLRPGSMDRWTAVWREHIKPLRESLGFTVPAAWTIPEKNQFVWLLAYEGPQDWETLDAAFHASRERAALRPDPAALIAEITTSFLAPVD